MSTQSTLIPLTQRPEWKALEEHYQQIRATHLRTLFAEDASRGEKFSLEAAGHSREATWTTLVICSVGTWNTSLDRR